MRCGRSHGIRVNKPIPSGSLMCLVTLLATAAMPPRPRRLCSAASAATPLWSVGKSMRATDSTHFPLLYLSFFEFLSPLGPG